MCVFSPIKGVYQIKVRERKGVIFLHFIFRARDLISQKYRIFHVCRPNQENISWAKCDSYVGVNSAIFCVLIYQMYMT